MGELGGAERVLLDCLASLRAYAPSLELHLLSFGTGPLLDRADKLGVNVELVQLPTSLQALGDSRLLHGKTIQHALRLLGASRKAVPDLVSFRKKLRALIESRAPDVVHTNGIKAHFLAASVVRRVPLVWHVHDFLSDRPVSRFVAKLLKTRVTGAVAISEAVARDLRISLPGIKARTVVNGVDVEAFAPGLEMCDLDPALSGLAPAVAGTLRVGLLATFGRWKVNDLFLRAAASFQTAAPQIRARFYIIGGPVYTTDGSQTNSQELRALITAAQLELVAGLVPFQDEPVQAIRALDVVVNASTRREPFGRSIVEAMSCGRAVVVPAAGGAGELVTSNMTGLVYKPGDLDSLFACIAQLLSSDRLRARLGERAREFAVQRFSRKRLGPELVSAYQHFGAKIDETTLSAPIL